MPEFPPAKRQIACVRGRYYSARASVRRAENHAGKAGVGNGGRAHQAWLERDYEYASAKAGCGQVGGASRDCQRFRVRERLFVPLHPVSGLGDYAQGRVKQNRANGSIARLARKARLRERQIHEFSP